MRLILPGLIVAVATAACSSITSTARGISIFLDANPKVVQLGDTVTFMVNVSANEVSGILIAFGDSKSDQSSTDGAPSARVTFKHTYADTGRYPGPRDGFGRSRW